MPATEINMLARTVFIMTFAAALGSGLVSGVFFAFSSFVMPALARIRAEQGIAAMQSVNVAVINPGFMLALFGTAVVALVLAVGTYSRWGQPGQSLILIASGLYIVGSAGVTMVCNVPLNDALAAVQSGSPDALSLWPRFLKEWTFWNHVRTLASSGSCALYIAALAVR
jgi:uncharacterized membrane protein